MTTDAEVTDDIWDHPHVRAVIPQMVDALTGPDADRRREVAEWVRIEALPKIRARVVGFGHYETSAFAREGRRCRPCCPASSGPRTRRRGTGWSPSSPASAGPWRCRSGSG